jgi:hypothetical protein
VARLDNNCYPRAPKRRVAHATTTGHRYAAARPMANRNRYRAARWRIGRRSCSTPCARAPGLPTTMLFGRAETDAFLPLFWRNMDAGARPRHPPPATGIAVPPGHQQSLRTLISAFGPASRFRMIGFWRNICFLALSQYFGHCEKSKRLIRPPPPTYRAWPAPPRRAFWLFRSTPR